MAPSPPRTPLAGGFLLALSLIVGAFIGIAMGQPSMGFVAGLGVGMVLLLLTWIVDRARRR